MAPKRAIVTYGKQPRARKKLRALGLALSSSFINLDRTMGFVPDENIPEPLIPKRPNSQKAATMVVEPDQGNVDTLSSIVGCDQNTARRYLRVKQNNLEQAMNAVLDGEDIHKLESASTWDDSAFGADRDGNPNLHPLGTSAAPTRGPSPARQLDLQPPTNQESVDDELARALAMSQQETGVVQSDGQEKAFGPATREHYEANQWAMVPASQEIVPDVLVQERWYDGKGPRFLKHLPDGDYTPNLITILHSIGKVREAFLMRSHLKDDYGSEPEWWKGHAIPMPRIVHTADGSAAQPDSDKYDELIAETQRLMAFLDQSQRLYASIDGIARCDIIKSNETNSNSLGTLLELFLQTWTESALYRLDQDHDHHAEQVRKLFTTKVGTTGSDGMETPYMTVVDLSIKSNAAEAVDLFELLDGLLWDTDPNDEEMPDNFIEEPADFLVMRVQHADRDATKLGLEIPDSFYVDKYLKSNIESTKITRRQMVQGKQRIAKIEEIENKLKTWKHPRTGAQIDAHQLVKHTHGHFSGQNRKAADEADTTNTASLAYEEPAHYPDIASKLERLVESIDKKLAMLAEEKEKTRQAIRKLSSAPPAGLEESQLKHKYSLRGVATKPNITYILQPNHANQQATDETTATPGYQWWRIDYGVSGSNATINRTAMDDYDVLRSVELEHKSALLVYANEEELDDDYYEPGLEPALEEFVRKDNDYFQRELEDAALPSYNMINHDMHDMSDIPRKSIERKSSMDSLNVGGGRSDDGYPDNDQLSGQHHEIAFDPPVQEIHLDTEEDMLPSGNVEMIQKAGHEPLVPYGAVSSDTVMGDAEGVAHVEDADTEMK